MSTPNPSSQGAGPSAHPSQSQQQSALLEPTLYSLLSSSSSSSSSSSTGTEALSLSLSSFKVRASKLSIHAEKYEVVERVYVARNPVVQGGPTRGMRWRSARRVGPKVLDQRQRKGKSDGRSGLALSEAEQNENGPGEADAEWYHHTLSYVSAPLRSAEYAQASVRAVVGVELPGLDLGLGQTADGRERDIEAFIDVLGFQRTHAYTLIGDLFHLPLPLPISNSSPRPLTLHLSIARMASLHTDLDLTATATTTATPKAGANENEPYIVRLHPSRPVSAVPLPGEVGLQELIGLMRDVTSKFDGLEWSGAL